MKKTGLRTLTAEHLVDYGELSAQSLPKLNSVVVASFFREESLYSFESVIKEYGRNNDRETTIVLGRPKRIVKVQRRFFYRVPVETRTTYRPLMAGFPGEEKIPAKIVNISEGGMLIATNGRISEGSLITVMVPAGHDAEAMEVCAEVLQVTDDFNAKQETTVARLRFDGSDRVMLADEHRKQLVTYLFEQQRLMLQARRLLNTAKKRS